jgi:hypothetical protein
MEQTTTVSEETPGAPRLPLGKEDLAKIAHVAVEDLEFLEMNDGNRLAYHVYLYLSGQLPTLADAIYEAKARTPIHPGDLERIIAQRLIAAGVA